MNISISTRRLVHALPTLALLAACGSSGGGGGGCPSGEAPECACYPDKTCAAPLTCDPETLRCLAAPNNTTNNTPDNNADNNAVTVTGLRVVVEDTNARACETLLIAPDRASLEATFAPGAVHGAQIPRGQRTALAFTAAQDAPFPADAVALTLRSPDPADADRLALNHVACFDAAGEPIPDAVLRIER